MRKIKWTKENCLKEARKYTSRADFRNNNSSAYDSMIRNGYLNELDNLFPKLSYTKEECKAEALKYISRSEFQRSSSMYRYSYNRGWIDDICKNMKTRISYSYNNVLYEAKKYNHRSDFQRYSKGAYRWAHRNKFLDDVCSHMEVKYAEQTRDTYKNRKTILYYVKINNVYKVGIAIHEKYKSIEDTVLKQRYNKYNLAEDNKLEIIDYVLFDDGVQAWDLEKYILSQNKDIKYKGEYFIKSKSKSGGESECFTRNIYEDIKYYFN